MSFESEPLSFADPRGLREDETSYLYSVLYHSAYKPEFVFSETPHQLNLQGLEGVAQRQYTNSASGIQQEDFVEGQSQVSQAGYQGSDFHFTDNSQINENDPAYQGENEDKKSGLYSKTYERRNRKKRPPNYYRQGGSQSEQINNVTDRDSSSNEGETATDYAFYNVQSVGVGKGHQGAPHQSHQNNIVHAANTENTSSPPSTMHNDFVSEKGINVVISASHLSSVKVHEVSRACPNTNELLYRNNDSNFESTQSDERTSGQISNEPANSDNVDINKSRVDGVESIPVSDDLTQQSHSAVNLDPASLVQQNELSKTNESSPATDTSSSAISTSDKTVDSSSPQQGAPPVSSPPPKSSWASLFKGTGTNSAKTVAYVEHLGQDGGMSSTEDVNVTNEASPQPPCSAEVNLAMKQLGEILLKHKINHQSTAILPRGLVNRANWCYINSTLQALLACPPFYHLMKALPVDPALSRGPSASLITDTIVSFMNEFSVLSKGFIKGGKKQELQYGSPIELTYVYKMLHSVQNSVFKMGRQEDAEEFLSCVLNGIHEEMLAAVKLVADKYICNSPEANGFLSDGHGYTSDDQLVPSSPEGADKAADGEEDEDDQWEQVGPKNKSVITRSATFERTPISEIFGGQMRSVLHQQGMKESATLEPFFTLQLDIQPETVWTLKDALLGLVSKEALHGFTSSKTKAEVEASRKLSLEELPPVLILHLKCFVYDKNGGCQKIVKKVEYSVDLEITKELLSTSVRSKYHPGKRMYKLFAVVNHHGTKAIGGHYTTNLFHPGFNSWIHASDHVIAPISVPSMLKHSPPRMPYLLYYRRCDLI